MYFNVMFVFENLRSRQFSLLVTLFTRKVAAPSHFLLTGHVEIIQPWLQRLLGMCGMQLSRLKVEDYCYVSLCGDVWCM